MSEKVSVVDHCVGDAGQGSVPAANRAAALCRLDDFVAEAVGRYARMRNVDRGPGVLAHVSQLSPHVRHRLVLESELIEAALARHGFAKVEKFTQEVFWRSYWKGWLELRPSVWTRYRQALSEHLRAVEGGEFAAAYARACEGRTGIDCFDAWIAELYATGYLHNHARMWFASIWVHTLGLPWELGADLFLRHLLDGDPASNTLSWRWVVGLQTAGKTYLARPDNIARYTEGRFAPRGLAARATVPPMEPAPAPRALAPLPPPPEGPAALLLTEEDLHPESLPLADTAVVAVGAAHAVAERSPRAVSPQVVAFTGAAQADALARASAHFGCADETLSCLETEPVIAWCRRLGVRCVVTAYAPVGPAQERLHALFQPLADAGIALHPVRRAWDEVTWPLATRGFFAFAQRIPELLRNPRLFQSAAGKGHRQ